MPTRRFLPDDSVKEIDHEYEDGETWRGPLELYVRRKRGDSTRRFVSLRHSRIEDGDVSANLPPAHQRLHGVKDGPDRQGGDESEKNRFAHEVIACLRVVLTAETEKRSRPIAGDRVPCS